MEDPKREVRALLAEALVANQETYSAISNARSKNIDSTPVRNAAKHCARTDSVLKQLQSRVHAVIGEAAQTAS